MSEFDDDFELDIEVDLSTSGEIDEGFQLQSSSVINFIEDDLLGSDDISLILTSSGLIEADEIELEPTLLLDMDEIDLSVDTVTKEEKFEVSVSPAQTALSLYRPHAQESFMVETSNQEIHDALYDIDQYGRESAKRVREYLDSPIFDILPKTARFKSPEFRKQQDFRSMLTSDFLNHRHLPSEFRDEHIIDRVFLAYTTERLPDLHENEIKTLKQVIKGFLLFANSVYDEAERLTELASYKPFPKTLTCPETVGNFTYVCKCGEEYPMPEGRPTLTFLIREMNKSPLVTLMNHTIPCEKCQVYLSLPTPLVEVLDAEMQDYVKRIKATYEQPRIYRPKLEDLTQMIPSNVQDLFQLTADKTIDAGTNTTTSYNTAFNNYSKLINMWMNTVTSKENLVEATQRFKDSPEVLELSKQLTLVDFGFVADLYSYQFTKTVIHYLEGFSSFAITKEKEAYYEYCKIEGYDKQAFPVEYAKKWIYDNAAYVASLNNIYSGDTKMAELHILPEYLDVLNYVVSLHLLAKPELLDKSSDLAKWLKKPTASLKTLEKIYKKYEPSDKDKLANSHRDLVNTTDVYDIGCWSDAYTFIRTIVSPLRYNPGIDSSLKVLATKAGRETAEQFYGQDIPEKLVVKPSLMFEEFMLAFKDFGYHLFKGAIVDEVRKNLAKGIELFRKAGLLHTAFKSHDQPVTDITNIILTNSGKELDQDKLLFELVVRVGDLPGELNHKRDEIGYKDILTNFEEFKDEFISDSDFMKKYGGFVECYL